MSYNKLFLQKPVLDFLKFEGAKTPRAAVHICIELYCHSITMSSLQSNRWSTGLPGAFARLLLQTQAQCFVRRVPACAVPDKTATSIYGFAQVGRPGVPTITNTCRTPGSN